SIFDRAINMVSLVSISFPEFFIAYIAIVLLASPAGRQIFPSLANISEDAGMAERLWRCALPAITLSLVIVAHMMRMTRAAIINVLSSPYIEMARLKGAKPWQIILRHALPNSWAPIVTVVALNLAYLVVGVVVVEFVFTYPGMGKMMVEAVAARDIPVVQACALVFAATYILLNLTADVIGIVTNPRLLHPK
ncbi:MAG TPA: ABC transporter permease, partial [Alphaproteobacteria bacterium]|nr:ABC transporter permease [Alphaproteobacteria bacterium]